MGVATALVAAFAAAPAAAAPFSISLNYGYYTMGSASSHFIGPPDDPGTLSGDLSGGNITGATLALPDAPAVFQPGAIEGHVAMSASAVSGTYNAGTGTLALQPLDLKVIVTVPTPATVCDDTVPLTGPGLSTAATLNHPGVSFASGLAGPGALAGAWNTVDTSYVSGLDVCDMFIDPQLSGTGGIWLSQNIDFNDNPVLPPPSPPPPAAAAQTFLPTTQASGVPVTSSGKCKKGRKLRKGRCVKKKKKK